MSEVEKKTNLSLSERKTSLRNTRLKDILNTPEKQTLYS